MAALSASGLAENTIVILTSDHGEMLGERGLWYKMSFFEGACRVPLVVASPGRFAPRRVGASVSLLDLLPTLVDFAGGDAGAARRDRRAKPRAASGGPARPRRGDRRISGGGRDRADGDDPPRRVQVHPFAAGPGSALRPHSRSGRTRQPGGRPRPCRNGRRIPRRGRPPLAARRARRRGAGEPAPPPPRRRGADDRQDSRLGFQPFRDAAQQYIRNGMDLDDLEARARFPRAASP